MIASFAIFAAETASFFNFRAYRADASLPSVTASPFSFPVSRSSLPTFAAVTASPANFSVLTAAVAS